MKFLTGSLEPIRAEWQVRRGTAASPTGSYQRTLPTATSSSASARASFGLEVIRGVTRVCLHVTPVFLLSVTRHAEARP